MNPQPTNISLLLVVPNRIFRLGLKAAFQAYPELEVMAEVESASGALKYLQTQRLSEVAAPPSQTDRVRAERVTAIVVDSVVEAGIDSNSPLPLCQNLKAWYPQYKIVLLTDSTSVDWAIAQQLGVEGYCPKTADRDQLVATLRQVAMGETYRVNVTVTQPESSAQELSSEWWRVLLHRWHIWGLKTISQAEFKLKQQQSHPGLSPFEQAVISGRLRELFVARLCVNWLLAPRKEILEFQDPTRGNPTFESNFQPDFKPNLVQTSRSSSPELKKAEIELSSSLAPLLPRKQIFETTAAHLQFDLENVTHSPLELDILKSGKRKELLQVILEEFEVIIEDLKFSKIQVSQLSDKKGDVLRDLWSAAITQFFGKYARLTVGDREVEIVPILLQDIEEIERDYLVKIPLFVELLSYWVYETPLMIDNRLYGVGTPEAQQRAQMLTQNLVIQVGNAVVNPLLNHFADVVAVKQIFYDRQLITSRKIERFRNNLSWKARQEQWFGEPKAIFESQYSLLVLEGREIRKVWIYAPRRQELDRLKGWSLVVTLLLEGRDAIAPRLRSLVASTGSIVVYVLTQVIGRGLGLVARGILQGVGNSWSDSRLSGNSDRQK